MVICATVQYTDTVQRFSPPPKCIGLKMKEMLRHVVQKRKNNKKQ